MASTEELAKAARATMWRYYEATKSTAAVHDLAERTLRSIDDFALDSGTDAIFRAARHGAKAAEHSGVPPTAS